MLMEALSKVPDIPPVQFDTLLNNSMQVSKGRWNGVSSEGRHVHVC